ncbi:hypothetical protein BED47_07865 [Gottfriedia luciferensis]|uniref:Uncharacterized protein n=1 Tax=Gottfriedia luciferensis TaxID=178774 RepID=A0ABX2ZMK2_9BACI|nr:hypothetical protein [Gottfriedia luciferensis]ODG90945.1 hypothetical protein BED47_07865 [Gottfriedia luciferensis]
MTSLKKGLWSTILSIVGIILFIVSYSISEIPTYWEKVVIGIFFFSGIASMITSIIFGILGVRSNEKGFLKYFGMIIVFLFVIGVTIIPVLLMAIFGFREP